MLGLVRGIVFIRDRFWVGYIKIGIVENGICTRSSNEPHTLPSEDIEPVPGEDTRLHTARHTAPEAWVLPASHIMMGA